MGRVRVYIKTFDVVGAYDTAFTEITQDVIGKVGKLKQSLDSAEFDLGVYKNSNVKLTLRNDHGLYGQVGTTRSIFPYKRDDSIIKITWDIRPHDLCVGFFKAGNEPLGEEIELYKGLITAVNVSGNVDDETLLFDVVGMESLFDGATVPLASLSVGDLISEVIYTCLNQGSITDLLTVSQPNIVVGLDKTVDALTDLETKTVKETLDEILLVSNSILYIINDTVFVTNRTPPAGIDHTFFGQSATQGLENIIDIKKYRDGNNRIRNFWTWKDTTSSAQDVDSINFYRARKQEIGSDLITNSAKIQDLLEDNRDLFSNPKQEMQVISPLCYNTGALNLNDRVNIDYPAIYVSADGNPIPKWGGVKWGAFKWPIALGSFEFDTSTEFGVLGREIDLDKETAAFSIREI